MKANTDSERRSAGRLARGVFAACLVLLSACSCTRLHEAPRDLLSEADYREQSAELLKQIPTVDELASSTMPLYGCVLLYEPESGSQAARAGMRAGDVVTGIDEVRFFDQWQSWQRTDTVQTLHYVTREGKSKQFEIQPGKVGVRHTSYRRPDLWYVREGQQNPKWDRHVLLALDRQFAQPDLAETAWYHAVKAGYDPDVLSLWSHALIAYYQGRTGTAVRDLETLDELMSPHPLVLYPSEKYMILLANGEVEKLHALFSEFPPRDKVPINDHTLDDMDLLREMANAAPSADKPPHELASAMKSVDIMPSAVKLEDSSVHNNYFSRLKDGLPFRFKQRVAFYKDIYFGTEEPVYEAELETTFTLRNMPGRSYYALMFTVGMLDRSCNPIFKDGEFGESTELLVGFEYDQDERPTLRIGHSNMSKPFHVAAKPMKMDGEQVHRLRMVKVGGAGEIFLDGRRLAYVPLREEIDLGFFLKTVGMDVNILCFEVNRLEADIGAE